MQKITFSKNQNSKLLLNIFGDARLHDEEKFFIGNELEAELNRKPLGIVKVIAVRPFVYSKITDSFAFLNCGKHAAYQATLFQSYYQHHGTMKPDTKLMHIIFQYTYRNLETHYALWVDFCNEIKQQQPFINTESE